MANTFTQIHIQAIFAVQNRDSYIDSRWKDELYMYITGIVRQNQHKLLAIGGIADHIHIFFGLRPSQAISDLMQDVKGSSSKWINERRFNNCRFSWQEGYSAFSYSVHDIDAVVRYINNQEEHHRKKTFLEEYEELLKARGIEYDPKYIFKKI